MSQTFNDLKVYKIAYQLTGKIELLVRQLPKFESFRHVDQILRSSRSIVANIVEGFGRKQLKGDFIKFLTYAMASCDETQAHLNLINLSGLIKKEEYINLIKQYKNLSVRLLNFINSIKNQDLKISPSEIYSKSIRSRQVGSRG
ncbi:four helix bundle protein [Patescibacteria group bacterium]|nr:four helix bundle protein [Patescibacteria group bacterium]